MQQRSAEIRRKTRETDVKVKLNIDGKGKTDIDTQIAFLDHMLELFAFHGLFDLELKARGDLKVDRHHTNEDIGICLGLAVKKALNDCIGIKRFGFAEVPMDKARAKVVLDIGNRYAFSACRVKRRMRSKESYSLNDAYDLLDSFAKNAAINLHIDIISGDDVHHILEAVFKALGLALDSAAQIDPRRKKNIPSTKGIL